MKARLFGGPRNGKEIDYAGDSTDYAHPEILSTGAGWDQILRWHTYVPINRLPLLAHDCRGGCPYPDVPGHTLAVDNDCDPPVHVVEYALRSWVRRTMGGGFMAAYAWCANEVG
jgi:hypothetical protein